MSMLHAIVSLSKRMRLEVHVAHVDHAVRKESSLDCAFIAKACKSLGVKFHSKRLKKKPQKDNFEAWARKQRYGFFQEVLARQSLDWVLTAHTADDVAETFLMKLVSNKEFNSIQNKDSERNLLRPLLSVSKAEVKAYAKTNSLKFRNDRTNDDTTFLRNRVRHKLLPLIVKEFDSRASETIAGRAKAIEEDINGLYAITESLRDKVNVLKFGSKIWLKTLRGELKDMPQAVAWRCVERLFHQRLGFNLGRDKSKELLFVILGSIQGVELPGKRRFRLSGGELIELAY